MTTLNLKPKSEVQNNSGWVILLFVLAMVAVQVYVKYKPTVYEPIKSELVINLPATEDYDLSSKFVHQLRSPKAEKIQRVWENVGSPIAHEIPWVVAECEKRDLNPELVLAVMAKESGWGRSEFCRVRGNCFGWGYTDSNPTQSNWEGEFEKTTLTILDSLAMYYNVDTAEQMAARGYNFHAEWIEGVNLIKSYYN